MRRANEILKATSVLFAKELDQPPQDAEAVISHLRDDFGVEPVCQELGLFGLGTQRPSWAAEVLPTPARRAVVDEDPRRLHGIR